MATFTPTPTDLDGLYATTPQALSFAPSLAVRAFLLERPGGNILVYNNALVDADSAALDRRGGVIRQYLGHWHESMFHPLRQPAPLFVHSADRPNVVPSMKVRGGFTRRHHFDDDFEVIPIPGHTPGSTAYLWDNGTHRFLFTGDSVYLDDGEWKGALLESSDRDAYLESLAVLSDVDFDLLVPWAATAGQDWWSVVDRAEARRRLDAVAEQISAARPLG